MRVRPVLLKKDEYDRFKNICVDEPAFFENFFFLGLWENWGKKFFFGFSDGKKKKFQKISKNGGSPSTLKKDEYDRFKNF